MTVLNDEIRKIAQAQEILSIKLAPFTKAMNSIAASQTMMQVARDANRIDELIRVAAGPIAEMHRQISYMNLAWFPPEEIQQLQNLVLDLEKRFFLPGFTTAIELLRQFENNNVVMMMKRYEIQMSELQRSLATMTTPWLDTQRKLRSIEGFVGLQSIGHALGTMQPFDTRLSDALRIDLGDWRKRIVWPQGIFVDPLARSSFYTERGLNPALTEFPPSTFKQSLAVAGIEGTLVPEVQIYDASLEMESDDDEAALERTNRAHDRLQRFETQMRRFIDERMTETFGTNWIKRQVPGNTRQNWLEKEQKAKEEGGGQYPLIAYADFTDYVPIIIRKDNWIEVFEAVFGRKASVEESFQRLYPIRICTMHSRAITQDDELYLLVETKRILEAIGITV